jgi:prepilin-type N-terminal cleavage/methylation domain-containing protein
VKRPRGFSIIEMMLAIFLLALGISTVAYTIPMASRGLTHARQVTEAAFFAEHRLEDALFSGPGPKVAVDPDNPTLTGEISRTVYPLDASLRLCRAVVYRTDDGTRRPIVVLETLGTGGGVL